MIFTSLVAAMIITPVFSPHVSMLSQTVTHDWAIVSTARTAVVTIDRDSIQSDGQVFKVTMGMISLVIPEDSLWTVEESTIDCDNSTFSVEKITEFDEFGHGTLSRWGRPVAPLREGTVQKTTADIVCGQKTQTLEEAGQDLSETARRIRDQAIRDGIVVNVGPVSTRPWIVPAPRSGPEPTKSSNQ